jgi:hypothetical protein
MKFVYLPKISKLQCFMVEAQRGQSYKTFFCGQGQSRPEWITFQVLYYRLGSWPYSQTLDEAGKAFQGQTL